MKAKQNIAEKETAEAERVRKRADRIIKSTKTISAGRVKGNSSPRALDIATLPVQASSSPWEVNLPKDFVPAPTISESTGILTLLQFIAYNQSSGTFILFSPLLNGAPTNDCTTA